MDEHHNQLGDFGMDLGIPGPIELWAIYSGQNSNERVKQCDVLYIINPVSMKKKRKEKTSKEKKRTDKNNIINNNNNNNT